MTDPAPLLAVIMSCALRPGGWPGRVRTAGVRICAEIFLTRICARARSRRTRACPPPAPPPGASDAAAPPQAAAAQDRRRIASPLPRDGITPSQRAPLLAVIRPQ